MSGAGNFGFNAIWVNRNDITFDLLDFKPNSNQKFKRIVRYYLTYIHSGKGRPFSCKNFLLNSLELYLSDLSHKIVTIVFPGPSFLPSSIAPAIFTPQLVPRLNPHFELL